MSDIVALVDRTFGDALALGATAVHFEPHEGGLRVRCRIDGALVQLIDAPASDKEAIVSHIKILAGMDPEEQRLPQDGRAVVRDTDLHITTVRTLHGEAAVARVLMRRPLVLDLEKQGLEPEDLARLRTSLEGPPGLVVVVGPTGSGRHTMQYAMLHQLMRTSSRKIVTIESPVRHSFGGLIQMNVDDLIGLNIATLLRTSLRLDPDVISLGDIPDFETLAGIANAVASGRRVIATAHVNSAPGALSRFLNMGLDPWLIADTVTLVQAQRLVRRLCDACKREDGTGAGSYRAAGCDACHNTGWTGRSLVVESLAMTFEAKRAILAGEPVTSERTLRGAALAMVRAGKTTVAEALRATPPDDAQAPASAS